MLRMRSVISCCGKPSMAQRSGLRCDFGSVSSERVAVDFVQVGFGLAPLGPRTDVISVIRGKFSIIVAIVASTISCPASTVSIGRSSPRFGRAFVTMLGLVTASGRLCDLRRANPLHHRHRQRTRCPERATMSPNSTSVLPATLR